MDGNEGSWFSVVAIIELTEELMYCESGCHFLLSLPMPTVEAPQATMLYSSSDSEFLLKTGIEYKVTDRNTTGKKIWALQFISK